MDDKKDKVIGMEKAYAKMARFCSQKENAPFDIARKLQRMDLPAAATDKIIDRLKKEKYIDEKRYIRSYINDKLRFNKWGRRKITLFLMQKQLPRPLIEEAFSELPGELFGESLLAMLNKKWKTVTGRSACERRAKLVRYALGRGFTVDEVMANIKKMKIGEVPDENE